MGNKGKFRGYGVINNSAIKIEPYKYEEMAWILDHWELILKGGDPSVDEKVLKIALSGMSHGSLMWRPLTAGELGHLWRLGKLRIPRYYDDADILVESELFLLRLGRSMGGDMVYFGIDPALKRMVLNNRNPYNTDLFDECIGAISH